MKKLLRGLLCGVMAVMALFAVSCTREVSYDVFHEKAQDLQKLADTEDRGTVIVSGAITVEETFFYWNGGGWSFKGTIDEQAKTKLQSLLPMISWSIRTDEFPADEWTFKVGSTYEVCKGDEVYKFDKKDGQLIEYTDGTTTYVITWGKVLR